MNKRIKLKYIDILFYLVIFIGFMIFYRTNEIQFNVLRSDFIFLVIGLKFLNFLLFNQLHLNIFHMYKLDIKKNENLTLTYKGYMGNFFGFGKTGTGYKALFLKNKFNFSYFKFVSFYIFLQTLTLFFTSSICFLLLFFTNISETELKSTLLVVLAFIMAISLLSNYILNLISKLKVLKKIKYLNNLLESTEQNNIFLKNLTFKNPKFIKVLILQIFIQFNLFLQIYLQAKSLDIHINLLNNFVYNLISQISIFLSVTPNAIGIKEFMLVLSNDFIGLSPADVFNLAVLDRLTDFLSLVVFSLFYYKFKKFSTSS
ncbi:MAG: hypothetical protein CBE33_02235 [Candidatus Pelagibacter sp. TMED273]|nr:MAG: hypothetical protein CBE33_02235 [Candidatus Pelagibacter sp. TMED273]|tara:strand:+ start:3616 stop:4560 length:945 start_codon:yes stop_codon:yes gene_type:complete